MKKVKILLGLISILTAGVVYSQQDPQYTQYMYNMNIVNPAYAGSRGVPVINLLGRSQWVNSVDGAPRTATLSVSSPMGKSTGLGLSVIYDEVGPVKETNAFVDFSYTLQTSDDGNLAFGLKAGASFLDVGYMQTITQNDPLNEPINEVSPNLGAGVYYYTDKFYVGLSSPNFLQVRHLENENGVESTASDKMHYFLTGGYVFDLNDDFLLKPSTMVKAISGSPVSIDLSANVLYKNMVEFGLSYRLDDSVSAMVGFQVDSDFRIGYAYDHTISNYGDYNSGSHEIMMLFEFNRRNIKSPRFF